MKKNSKILIFLLTLCFLVSCMPQNKHTDSFYDINDGLTPKRIPLIKPIDMNISFSSDTWDLDLKPSMWRDYPDSQGLYYLYGYVHDVDKFTVINGIIMAYSMFVDTDADAYIQDNFYHWFVLIPEKEITTGFHTEDEFTKYIQSLGADEPEWQTPDNAYKQFKKTGCLEWIPDCDQQ